MVSEKHLIFHIIIHLFFKDDEDVLPKKEETIEKENPKELKKADQPVVNRRSKRTAATITTSRIAGLKRVKTCTNILLQRDSNMNSEINPESLDSVPNSAYLAQVPSIDLTLDDD